MPETDREHQISREGADPGQLQKRIPRRRRLRIVAESLQVDTRVDDLRGQDVLEERGCLAGDVADRFARDFAQAFASAAPAVAVS